MNEIRRFRGEYFFLSNFYPIEIKYEEFTYPSLEHAYMAQKSNSFKWRIFCTDSFNTAGLVKTMSKQEKLVEDWEEKKVELMEKLLRIKFTHISLRKKLLETGDKILIEGNWHGDKFWGKCLKTDPPVGENILGRLLMKIRSELESA